MNSPVDWLIDWLINLFIIYLFDQVMFKIEYTTTQFKNES